MINCTNCNSTNMDYRGALMQGRQKMAKLCCFDCGINTYMYHDTYMATVEQEDEEDNSEELVLSNKVVVTSAVIGHQVNVKFLESLEAYCDYHGAKLLIIPIKYKNVSVAPVKDSPAESYYITENIDFGNNYKIMGGLKLHASMEHPLAGLEPLSKGNSIIFGHPQVALKTVSTENTYPAIISTTGCVTEKFYSDTKQGLKANFNHSHSAVVLEDDGTETFIRHLNFDGEGFYDLTNYYTPGEISEIGDEMSISALVTGDEHVLFQDEDVVKATYTNDDSIVNVLHPTNIVRHDVLDSYSISHHHKHNVFTKFAKFKDGFNSIKDELDKTIDFIIETTPTGSKSVIVSSNHNDHLMKWLNECDPSIEPWNAEIYHWFMYKMLSKTEMGESGAETPNPFQLYVQEFYSDYTDDIDEVISFIGRNDSYMIDDVSVNCHGDVGTNGSRGSRRQFSNLPTKHIIGHSHSPGIEKGAYQVGTSSRMQLEYNRGPSSWDHCHCIIYPNGKRQLLFIRNGKWKAE